MDCDKYIARFGYFILCASGIFILFGTIFGIDTFRSDLCYTPVSKNFLIFFVVSSIASLVVIAGSVFHYQDTSFILNGWFYGLIIPLTIVLSVLFFVFIRTPKIISAYDDVWQNGIEEKYVQIHHHCCGWNNFSDRSIIPCPFDYISGCKGLYQEYFSNRVKQLNMFYITFLSCFTLGSFLYISISACCHNNFGVFDM